MHLESRNKGQLGFRKIKKFNQAPLAKLACMVVTKYGLCIRLLRSNYKVRDNWLKKIPPKVISPIWKGIAKQLICKRTCFIIGDRRYMVSGRTHGS